MYVYHRRLYTFVQLALDTLSLTLIWQLAIQLRILLNPIADTHVTAQEAATWAPPLGLILLLWIVISLRLRLYRIPDEIHLWTVLIWAGENTVVLSMLTVVATFFSRQLGESVSRSFVLLMLPVTFFVLAMTRCITLGIVAQAQKRWFRPLRIALVGDSRGASRLIGRIKSDRVRTAIRGLIVPEGSVLNIDPHPLPVLGTTRQIAELINREQLDRIIVLNGSLLHGELERCNQVFRRMGVPVSCVVDLAPAQIRVDLSTQYGVPFVEMIPVQFTRTQEVIKRVFDVTLALFALVVLAPLLLAIAALVKLTSKGPVLYKAPRVGKGGRHFIFLKFRSMYLDNDRSRVDSANEKSGHIFKIRNDPRVTPIGRFLRRYSLDELPQLINVMRGEMSLVGPRPLPARDLDPDGMSQQFSAWSEGRARVQPGLTGLWQIGGRSDLAFEDMIRLDLQYIQNWSLALDISIILETPMLVLRGVGAY
jgi:exopolysaccharide biosynthesis polyprenyl glycosylphosphotransferase